MNALGGYMSLAAAIVESGRKQNDELFLKSSWCQFLVDTVADYADWRLRQTSNISENVKRRANKK